MSEETPHPKEPFRKASDPDLVAQKAQKATDPREQDIPDKDNTDRKNKPKKQPSAPNPTPVGNKGVKRSLSSGEQNNAKKEPEVPFEEGTKESFNFQVQDGLRVLQAKDADKKIAFSPDIDLTPDPAVDPDSWRKIDTAWTSESGLTARLELTENDSEPAIDGCHIGKLDVRKHGELVASFDGQWALESDDPEVSAYIDALKEKYWHRNADIGPSQDPDQDNNLDI